MFAKFRPLLAAAAVSLALMGAGCAQLRSVQQGIENAYETITSAAVTPAQAYIAINAYDAAVATSTQVLKLPLCSATVKAPCRAAGVREAIKKFILSGRVARNQVKAYLRANPGKDLAITSLDDLKSATGSLQQIIAVYKAN